MSNKQDIAGTIRNDLSMKEREELLQRIYNSFEGKELDRALSLFWEMTH